MAVGLLHGLLLTCLQPRKGARASRCNRGITFSALFLLGRGRGVLSILFLLGQVGGWGGGACLDVLLV